MEVRAALSGRVLGTVPGLRLREKTSPEMVWRSTGERAVALASTALGAPPDRLALRFTDAAEVLVVSPAPRLVLSPAARVDSGELADVAAGLLDLVCAVAPLPLGLHYENCRVEGMLWGGAARVILEAQLADGAELCWLAERMEGGATTVRLPPEWALEAATQATNAALAGAVDDQGVRLGWA